MEGLETQARSGRTMLGLLQLESLIHNMSSGPSQYFERESQGNKTGGRLFIL